MVDEAALNKPLSIQLSIKTMMTYNKIRHLELLRCFLDFKKQGKNLYRENRDEYMELLHYQGRLEDHAF